MRTRKDFSAPGPDIEISLLDSTPEFTSITVQPSVSYSGTTISLEKWIGIGIDEWVYLIINQMSLQNMQQQFADASLVTYGRQCIPYFLQFLLKSKPRVSPTKFSQQDLHLYIQEIEKTNKWSKKSKQTLYGGVRALLLGLAERGQVGLRPGDFPARPFAGLTPNPRTEHPHPALTNAEVDSLYAALKQDLIAIHRNKFPHPSYEALVVTLLALALRTGINTTPLLEIKRDALEAHPFLPNMRILRTVKRRAHSENLKPLRGGKPGATGIPLDAVGLFEFAISLTADAAKDAPDRLKNSVWLYRRRSSSRTKSTSVVQLHSKELYRGISNIVSRHSLVDDQGRALCINLSRIRSTVENQLWNLSGGKADEVALAMGHSKNVSDRHYLQVTNAMRAEASIFATEIPTFVHELAAKGKSHELGVTPVGHCSGLSSKRQPTEGNESLCGDFMQCFRCSSFAIVGSHEDLYRLYSYYWFLSEAFPNREKDDISKEAASIMEKIDDIVKNKFDNALGKNAKNLAMENPHPFWKKFRSLVKLGGK